MWRTSTKIPPVSPSELARTQVPSFSAAKPGIIGTGILAPSDILHAPGAANLPQGILRVLIQLAEDGLPLDVLDSAPPGIDVESRKNPYLAASDRTSSQVRVVSELLRAVDRGAVPVEELNAFLALLAIQPPVVKRALIEIGRDPDQESLALNDAVYRLVSGRLIAGNPSAGGDVPRLWLKTIAGAVVLGLLAAAVIRFR